MYGRTLKMENPQALQALGTGAAQPHALQESDTREAPVLLGTSEATWAVIPTHWEHHIHYRSYTHAPVLQEPGTR